MILKNSKYYILIGLLFIVLMLGVAVWQSADGLLKVKFLDIGQGDSFLIVSPTGNQILIDGGPDGKVLNKLGRYMPFYDKTIELIILSHPQADHLAGLVEVLKRYKIEKILTVNDEYDSALFREWKNLLNNKNIEFISAQTGQFVDLGGGAYFLVFYPFKEFNGEIIDKEKINDLSVIGKLVYGNSSVLFTGDSEIKTELNLLRTNLNLKSDILKVAHHGSRTSTHLEFLEKVNPYLAIISDGRNNRYGHPNKTILERLKDFGAEIFRTDILGDINLISNGISWSRE